MNRSRVLAMIAMAAIVVVWQGKCIFIETSIMTEITVVNVYDASKAPFVKNAMHY